MSYLEAGLKFQPLQFGPRAHSLNYYPREGHQRFLGWTYNVLTWFLKLVEAKRFTFELRHHGLKLNDC